MSPGPRTSGGALATVVNHPERYRRDPQRPRAAGEATQGEHDWPVLSPGTSIPREALLLVPPLRPARG